MASKEQRHVIVLIKNYWEGLVQSVCWFVVLAVAMAFAVWIDSVAMQWIMGMTWLIALISSTVRRAEKMRFTPDEALEKISAIKSEAKETP